MVNQEQATSRPNINLDMIGIRLGDVLGLVDVPATTCVVVELYPPRVLHDREVKSLTAACNDAYGMGWNDPAGVWMFNGETLRARRERFETYHRAT